jgi:segregation and condensation protein B
VSGLDITAEPLPVAPDAALPPAAANGAPAQAALPALLESLLFVAAEPTPVSRLAQILDAPQEAVEIGLADLGVIYRTGQRGIRLQRKGERVQLTTAPEAASYIERFLGLDLSARLSPAALEALSVVAYKQPLTRADLEAVRGVNCDGVLRTLLARELIEPVGRLEQPGRPFQYGTTGRFLQYLGLESLADLPLLPESSV